MMANIPQRVRRTLNRFGIDLVRVPRAVKGKRDGNLGFYRTGIGNYYVPIDAPDDVIAAYMRAGQIFEPEVVETARRFVTPGSTVIDVGANFGQMTLAFSELVGPTGRVYAIEAQRRVHDILLKNIAANSADNVVPVFKAAYTKTGEVFHFPPPDFSRFGAYGSFNLPLDATAGDQVESAKIDDLDIAGPVSFLKVDVQGCDLFAMQGARATIEKHRMPILFEYEQQFQAEYGTSLQDYVEFIRSIGYRFAETILDRNYLVVPRD